MGIPRSIISKLQGQYVSTIVRVERRMLSTYYTSTPEELKRPHYNSDLDMGPKSKSSIVVAITKAVIYFICFMVLLAVVAQGINRLLKGDSKAIVKTLPSDKLPFIAFTGLTNSQISYQPNIIILSTKPYKDLLTIRK